MMVRMRSSLVIAAVFALGSAAAADPTKADQLFDEGKQLSDKGQWQPACDKFAQAIQLDPEAPGTLLNLGRCNEKLGKIGTALGWYQKADEHAQKYNMPEYQKAAKAQIAELSPRVPSLRFEFAEPLPAGGRLFVDGTEVAQKDQARLAVDPGAHKVDVQVPHKAPIHHDVTVTERQDLQVPIGAFAAAEFVDPGRARRHRGVVFGAIGAGMFVGQGVVGFGGKLIFPDQIRPHTQGWDDVSYGLTAIGVVGVAGLAYGAYLYVTAPKPYEADRATAWVPIAGPDQLGVAYLGRF